MQNTKPLFAFGLLLISTWIGFTAAAAPADVQETYRVVSYNIKRGLGNDGVTDLQRAADVLQDLKPDFVGLQEVDENVRRSDGIDQAAVLGKCLDMHHAFAPFMPLDGGRYGLAMLSRYPIQETEVVTLPEGNEPRVALVITVKLPSGSLIKVVNLHFDWVNDDSYRFRQATALKTYLDKLSLPYIVVGDFNDGPDSRTLDLLREGMIEAKKPADDRYTFSSSDPRVEIDYIFAAPARAWKVGSVKVIDEPLASDHRPVFAELQLVNEDSTEAE